MLMLLLILYAPLQYRDQWLWVHWKKSLRADLYLKVDLPSRTFAALPLLLVELVQILRDQHLILRLSICCCLRFAATRIWYELLWYRRVSQVDRWHLHSLQLALLFFVVFAEDALVVF